MAKSPSKRFLIDGFPRKMDQAKKFEKTVSFFNDNYYYLSYVFITKYY